MAVLSASEMHSTTTSPPVKGQGNLHSQDIHTCKEAHVKPTQEWGIDFKPDTKGERRLEPHTGTSNAG